MRNRVLIFALTLIALLLVAACRPIVAPSAAAAPVSQGGGVAGNSDGSGKGDGSGPSQTNPPSSDDPVTPGAVFDVVAADGTKTPFTLQQLSALPLISILSYGQPQEGPSLVDVLAAAGIETYGGVTLTGVDGEVMLAAGPARTPRCRDRG